MSYIYTLLLKRWLSFDYFHREILLLNLGIVYPAFEAEV